MINLQPFDQATLDAGQISTACVYRSLGPYEVASGAASHMSSASGLAMAACVAQCSLIESCHVFVYKPRSKLCVMHNSTAYAALVPSNDADALLGQKLVNK
jgi:hypothetical protein